MGLEIQVISDENIKPSSPTPEKLRIHQHSLFDQNSHQYFMALVYFYLPDGDDNQTSLSISTRLKKSLSEILNVYYPLAGRLVGGQYIECNDEGAQFIEAKANSSIDVLVKNPIPGEYNKLIPFELSETRDLLLAVQLTHFGCGGVSIGITMSHKIADALSYFSFINSWAAVARGENDLRRPIFEAAQIFPPNDEEPRADPQRGFPKEEIVGKVFTFPSSKISDLQNRLFNTNGGNGRRPSRVGALSAFIWSRFYSAAVTEPDPTKIHAISNVMNLRTRFDPPLSENLFGNITGLAIAVPATEEDGRVINDTGEVVRKIHESFEDVNGPEYVNRLRNNNNKFAEIMKERMEMTKKNCELVLFMFTSLSRFPWNEADFGWGKPVRVGLIPFIYKYLVLFLDCANGDGIEAWIHLKKEDMDKLQNDPELQKLLHDRE